jgi:hypothetical protein
MQKLGTTSGFLAGLFLMTIAVKVLAHGDVTPHAVDTSSLKQIGTEWAETNPYRGDAKAATVGAPRVSAFFLAKRTAPWQLLATFFSNSKPTLPSWADQIGRELAARAVGDELLEQVGLAFGQQFLHLRVRSVAAG